MSEGTHGLVIEAVNAAAQGAGVKAGGRFADARAICPELASQPHDAEGDAALLERAYAQVEAALRRGEVVCIFPEGMITHDGAMNRFRDGVSRIVERTPVPVVPLALRGMWGSFFSRRGGPAMRGLPRRFWSKIELVAGPPVAPEAVDPTDLQARVQTLLSGDE